MSYIIIPSRRLRQPQHIVSLNPAIPRPSFLFCPSVGLMDWTKPSRIGTKASGDSLRGTAQGVSYKFARAAAGGLEFGAEQPISGALWTMAVLANPASTDGQGLFISQRYATSPFPQIGFNINASETLSSAPGQLSITQQAANRSVKSTATTYADGNWHVYTATRNGSTTSFPSLLFDGGMVAVTNIGSGTGTDVSASQTFRLGNPAQYDTDNAFCLQCDMALAVIWNALLPDSVLARFNPNEIWGQIFDPDVRRIYFGAGGGTGAYNLDAQPGGYTVSGTAATLLRGIVLDAQPATYTVSGTAASIVRGYNLNAATGTFTATGAAATLLRGLSVNAAPGSFAVTGTDATLEYTQPGIYTLDAQPGSYSLTGVAATLTYTPLNAYTLDAQPASYVITGAAATLTYAGASIWTDVGVTAATWSDVGTATSIWTDL